MRKHVIYGHYGNNDIPDVEGDINEHITFLDLLDKRGRLAHGLGDVVEKLAKFGLQPSQVGLELLILASHVQAADTRISRSTESQDSWTREIKLVVPIIGDVNNWKETSEILKQSLDFLTGDLWQIDFRKSTYEQPLSNTQNSLVSEQYESLSLFSGGLDSLIGAVDLLESGNKTLFVSHAGDSTTSKAQNDLFGQLRENYHDLRFDRIRLWMSFPQDLIEGSQPEMTMRSRSFLFFALGVAAGSGFNNDFTLLIPENGLIALNVPLDSLRLGSHSTHTTHPFYISRWNDLVKALGINGRLENPYWDRTKGEMTESCLNKELLSKLIPLSLSCSSPSKGRWNGKANAHCGYCVPCIIRRAAIFFNSIKDDTEYVLSDLHARPLNTKFAEGRQIRSFQLAIKRLEKNPTQTKYVIFSSGPLHDVSLPDRSRLSDVYTRGLREVSSLLDKVVTEPLSQ